MKDAVKDVCDLGRDFAYCAADVVGKSRFICTSVDSVVLAGFSAAIGWLAWGIMRDGNPLGFVMGGGAFFGFCGSALLGEMHAWEHHGKEMRRRRAEKQARRHPQP